jgi:hypothetical protein
MSILLSIFLGIVLTGREIKSQISVPLRIDLSHLDSIFTLHFYQSIVDRNNLPDSFLEDNNGQLLVPWTISYGIGDHLIKHNITKIKQNLQSNKLSGSCDINILMKMPMLETWLPDISPVTPSKHPTLTLAFWEYNLKQDMLSRKHGEELQRSIQSFAGYQTILLLSTSSDLSEVKFIDLLCFYCPEKRISVELNEIVETGNIIMPRADFLRKLNRFDSNLHLKSKAVVDFNLRPKQGGYAIASIREKLLRRRTKINPCLTITYELQQLTNFTPKIIAASRGNSDNIQTNFTETEKVYANDKITAFFLDIHVKPRPTFHHFSVVTNSFKNIIYCENKLKTKSENKPCFLLLLIPYDYASWGVILLILIVARISIKLFPCTRNSEGKPIPSPNTFSFIRTIFRQPVTPRLGRIHLVLMVGFVIVMSVYEGVITSRVIAPEHPSIHQDYLSLFKAGFKIYCRLVTWRSFQLHIDYFEIVLALNSTRVFRQANLGGNSWWVKSEGENNLRSYSLEQRSQFLEENKLALPISDKELNRYVFKLNRADPSRFCHLVPQKIQTGRLIWLFDGNLSNVIPIQKAFSRLLETGIIFMYAKNYKWFRSELPHNRELARLGQEFPKPLELTGKAFKILSFCAFLLLIALVVLSLEMVLNKFRTYRCRNVRKDYVSRGRIIFVKSL